MSDYDDNLGDFLREIDAMMPKQDHTLKLQNNMDYSVHLQNRAGFYVFNDAKLRQDVVDWLEKMIQAGLPLNDANLRKALDAAGYQYIDFLRTLTSKMRPPVKLGEGMRRAYPGGWSDVSGALALAFQHSIDGGASRSHG